MSVRAVVFSTAQDLATQLALEIARGLQAATNAGRPYLLAGPAGRSATRTYHALAEVVSERRISLNQLVLLSLDAYVDVGPTGFVPVAADLHHSCERYIEKEVVSRLNSGRPAAAGVSAEHVWFPDANRPSDYDEQIRECGGIDMLILASGSGDGHVGFNPPGAPRQSATRVVALPESTRRDNLRTYPDFTCMDDVPTHGVTMGIATMADLARRAVLVLPGAEKSQAYRRVRGSQCYDAEWPASVVAACVDGVVYADRPAAGFCD